MLGVPSYIILHPPADHNSPIFSLLKRPKILEVKGTPTVQDPHDPPSTGWPLLGGAEAAAVQRCTDLQLVAEEEVVKQLVSWGEYWYDPRSEYIGDD
jgi:hypothetical protein